MHYPKSGGLCLGLKIAQRGRRVLFRRLCHLQKMGGTRDHQIQKVRLRKSSTVLSSLIWGSCGVGQEEDVMNVEERPSV